MFRHTLSLFIRHIRKHTSVFLINLIGLSAGLTCAIGIYLWAQDEWNVDRFHKHADRLFVVLKNTTGPNGVVTFDETPGMLAKVIVNEMAEVQHAVAVVSPRSEDQKGVFIAGENKVEATDFHVSRDFFNVFSFPLVQGNGNTVLSDLSNIVISTELASKLFHTSESVIGRQVNWIKPSMSGTYTVAGVFKKVPVNSTLQFDVLFNYDLLLQKSEKLKNWKNGGPTTYLLLRDGVDSKNFNSRITHYIQQKGAKESLFIQRFSERYLHGQYENGVPAGGRIRYVRLFAVIAIFIIIIACINFMNLSIASGFTRLKEVGVKKVMGAPRAILVSQYVIESMLVMFISLLFSLVALWLLLPVFNKISGKQLSMHFDLPLIAGVLLITITAGLIAGSYPALYLSALKPANVFKRKIGMSPNDLWLRKGLLMFQFSMSISLIAAVLVVHRQLQFIQTKNIGYHRENVIYFAQKHLDAHDQNHLQVNNPESFIQDIRNLPGVVHAASFRHNIAAGRDGGTTDVQWQGKRADQQIQFTDIAGGYDLIETLGIQLKEGRSYSRKFGDEKSKIIFNESAIAIMGLSNPVGKTVRVWGEEKQIVGVVKDFHFQSMYESIKPCFIDLNENPNHAKIMVKILSGAVEQTIAEIEKIYNRYNAGLAFEYRFMDQEYAAMYVAERRVEILSGFFAVVVIIISCLGLFGLAAFNLQKRYKEIGIRKALGSSNSNIILLLWREFNKIIVASLVIALPLSYLLMKSWLQDFAYRIHLSPWYFLMAGALVVVITGITIGCQTFRALRIRPAESLRGE